jgi:hypothetical protein
MEETTIKIDDKTGSPTIEKHAALAGFLFEDGYVFSATDLGNKGVKIELSHRAEDSAAVILPIQKAEECGRWLLQTLGQRNRDLLKELLDVLKRQTKQKGLGIALQRGDKKVISDAIKMLKWQPQQN